MELSIAVDLVIWVVLGFTVGLLLGWLLAGWRGGQKQAGQVAELRASTRVLEEKLSGQQAQYEAQLKLLQEAKVSLGQEFENLANRIFDDKQAKFSAQSKEALEVSLSPLRRDIGDFRKQVETAYDKENADRNKLVGHISELQKQTLQISRPNTG